MTFDIIDSATGETLGRASILGMDDEAMLTWLCKHGYLVGGPDHYEITRSYAFAEGELVVIDIETQVPVLKLEVSEDSLKAA